MRYFSSLTSKQKDKTILSLRILKNNLHDLPFNLAVQILRQYDLDIVMKEHAIIWEKIQKQRVFKHKGIYYPLNFKEIIN